jgi:hypothetical protein
VFVRVFCLRSVCVVCVVRVFCLRLVCDVRVLCLVCVVCLVCICCCRGWSETELFVSPKNIVQFGNDIFIGSR